MRRREKKIMKKTTDAQTSGMVAFRTRPSPNPTDYIIYTPREPFKRWAPFSQTCRVKTSSLSPSPFPLKTIIIIKNNNSNNRNNVLLLGRVMRLRLNGWKRFVRIPYNNILWSKQKKNEHQQAYILHYNILCTYTQTDKLNFTRLVNYCMYIYIYI